MSLPKLQSPYFPVKLHGSGKTIKIRPFTVKEEKILMMAGQDKDDTNFILESIFQVLDLCIQGEDINARNLATFDVENLFIHLRSKSVSNIAKVRFKDDEDEKTYEVEVDLDKVVVSVPEDHTNKITLNDEYVVTMKYPTFGDFGEATTKGESVDPMALVIKSLDKLVNVGTNEVFDLQNEYSPKEVSEFVDSFTSKNMRDIEQFYNSLPTVKLEVEYITEGNVAKKKEIVGLVNFFTL
jgi:hypothetical protein